MPDPKPSEEAVAFWAEIVDVRRQESPLVVFDRHLAALIPKVVAVETYDNEAPDVPSIIRVLKGSGSVEVIQRMVEQRAALRADVERLNKWVDETEGYLLEASNKRQARLDRIVVYCDECLAHGNRQRADYFIGEVRKIATGQAEPDDES